jgi:hypothetical protein
MMQQTTGGAAAQRVVWKGWVEIGGKRFYAKSKWERRYALYLQFLKEHNEIKDWSYEPKDFWFDKIKRGVRSYKPDFLVIHNNGREEYVEVKGFFDAKSKTKIKRMRIYHPTVQIRLVSSDWFKTNGRTLKNLIKEW